MPHRFCKKGGQVNISWYNWKKAREDPFQFLKVSTTWQLLSDYRGWTWLCQPKPKTPSKKSWVTAKQFHTRILQRRGMGSELMNHQLNSLFRSREGSSFTVTGSAATTTKYIPWVGMEWTEPWKKAHDCKFNKSYKKSFHWTSKKIQTKNLTKSRETCRFFALCYSYQGTSIPGHSDDCARSTFSCKHPANVKNYSEWGDINFDRRWTTIGPIVPPAYRWHQKK